jgi:hypothetical protein
MESEQNNKKYELRPFLLKIEVLDPETGEKTEKFIELRKGEKKND